MKQLFLVIFSFVVLILFCHEMADAQGYTRGAAQGNSPKEAKVTGTIIDGGSNQAVPFASIAIYQAKDSTLLTGVLSNANGSFVVDKLP